MKPHIHVMAALAVLLLSAPSLAQEAPEWGIWSKSRSGGKLPCLAEWQGKGPHGCEANGDPLWICVAEFNDGLHPGKIRPGFGGCNIPWGGREHTVNPYRVLTMYSLNWGRFAKGKVPGWAKEIGYEADGEPLFVCRASYKGGFHPGKIRPGFGGCNIPWGGLEVKVSKDYQVLVGHY